VAQRRSAIVEGDLVAVSLPPGEPWPDIVRTVWDAGAAVLPVDAKLARAATDRVLRTARPTVHATDENGPGRWRRTHDGLPVDAGVALVVATSGTAGSPKLVEVDRTAIEAAVSASAEALEATSADGWLCCLPPAHIAGMLVLLRGLLLDAPVEVHPSFEASRFGAARDVAFTSVVPTMLVRLLDSDVDLSSFRAILVGGAHLPTDLRERAERRGASIVETYGLTESCGGVVYDGLPLRGVRVRTDAAGRIELGGATLMRGYRFDPDATAEAFTDDGWLRTRDAGTIDEAGRLRVAGRIDDAITTGGEKVWPRDVEAAIAPHPKIAEVLVVGRPDAEWGERLVAVVVPREPADPPTLEEVRSLAAAAVGRHLVPRELEVVERLPRTVLGKAHRLHRLAVRPE
jgi:O-succinylbenzoic acid--CoA ligase